MAKRKSVMSFKKVKSYPKKVKKATKKKCCG